jgi:hypothetical protein
MVLFLIEFVRMFVVDRYTIFTVHSTKNLLFLHVNQHQSNIARNSEVRIVLSWYNLCLNYLTLNLLTTTIVALPSNASKWQMGFNSAFKGLILASLSCD